MPELPEVETVARGLAALLPAPCTLTDVQVHCGDLRRCVDEEKMQELKGQPLLGIHRRAKYLLFEFRNLVLINHLGMTGSWRQIIPGQEKKHDHCLLRFSNGADVVFNDPRRFGILEVVKKGTEFDHPSLKFLGPEPLEDGFDAEYVFQSTRGKRTPIKSWLMDQRRVVGVGNIYACEALFRAKVRPQRLASRLKRNEAQALIKGVQSVLKQAIAKGGTTFRDFKQAGGGEGEFYAKLAVYDRKGKPCRRCKTSIQHFVIAGRSTYWCKVCQK